MTVREQNAVLVLKGDLAVISSQLKDLTFSVETLKRTEFTDAVLIEFVRKIDRLELLINGDPTRDVKGIRVRLDDVEKEIELLLQLKQQVKYILLGVAVSGGTGLINAGSLIALLAKLFIVP